MMKKTLSLLLALLTAFSVLTVSVSAMETEPLVVFDLLKHDTDTNTRTCRTVEIQMQRQMNHCDSSKQITFQTAQDQIVAVCKPYADNICKYDLYAPDGSFGVSLDPVRLYYLHIPEGAYYTDGGVPCAEYVGECRGVTLTSTEGVYTVADLGLTEFLATNFADSTLYAGRIRIDLKFDTYTGINRDVTLYHKKDGEYEKVGVYPITSFKKGSADITFGGVEINRYDAYILHVDYGTFTDSRKTLNGHCDYPVSGKKLLGQREDYPALDLLLRWFGPDHWTIKAILTVLNVLAKIKLVDADFATDIKNYIKATKK